MLYFIGKLALFSGYRIYALRENLQNLFLQIVPVIRLLRCSGRRWRKPRQRRASFREHLPKSKIVFPLL